MPYSAREVLVQRLRAGFVETRTLPTGTFRKILKQAGLSEAEFREL